MKRLKKIFLMLLISSFVLSCEDDIMEWRDLEESQRISAAEIPLELEEKISRYEDLNTYSDFVLGAGIILDLYMSDENYRAIVNENFDDVTVGYAMKHGAMVANDGSINFENVDNFIARTNEAGINVYGHTLVWHANQNANYLNSLIEPTVIPGTSGNNVLPKEGLEDESFTNWARNNPGDGITIEEGEGLGDGAAAIQLIAGSAASQPFNLQLATPAIPAEAGRTYEISFYIRSDEQGRGRISFDQNLSNQYPYKDWYGEGGEQTEFFETTVEWQQVQFTVDDLQPEASTFSFNFDLGYLQGVTYYIDIESLSVVDLDAEGGSTNLIGNSDFENATLDGWSGYGNESTRTISEEGAGFGNEGYAMLLTNPTAAQSYEAQQVYNLDAPLEEGTEYTFSFNIKASTEANIQVQLQNENYEADYSGGISVGTEWTQITQTITTTSADRIRFIFDFGEVATTYTIDNVVLTNEEAPIDNSDPVIIELPDEEKEALIDAAMEDWIIAMMQRYSDEVPAWDVVNEPMLESGTLRDGNVADLAADDFYWVKYLGRDYAVTAFNLARQYGNPSDVLFINDYNLESSLAKCDGLIEYVKYIESQGASVDGIGTQMHISLDTNRDNIVEMFQKLAASGKLIKVSELDVRLGTASPTQEQLLEQADMYKFVVDSFKEYIPEGQQYGITLWNISDNEQEHEFWLPEESPNVWNADYERKPAYKSVADGLAGRDVSEDFSGELQD